MYERMYQCSYNTLPSFIVHQVAQLLFSLARVVKWLWYNYRWIYLMHHLQFFDLSVYPGYIIELL